MDEIEGSQPGLPHRPASILAKGSAASTAPTSQPGHCERRRWRAHEKTRRSGFLRRGEAYCFFTASFWAVPGIFSPILLPALRMPSAAAWPAFSVASTALVAPFLVAL